MGSVFRVDVGDLRPSEASRRETALRRVARRAGEPEIPGVHAKPHRGPGPGVQRSGPLLGAQLDGGWTDLAEATRRMGGNGRDRDRVLRGLNPGRSHHTPWRDDPPPGNGESVLRSQSARLAPYRGGGL